jgi:hypothetical protein
MLANEERRVIWAAMAWMMHPLAETLDTLGEDYTGALNVGAAEHPCWGT